MPAVTSKGGTTLADSVQGAVPAAARMKAFFA